MHRQAFIAFCIIGFAVAVFSIGKITQWGFANWSWWFVGGWVACMFLIAGLAELAEKRNRRHAQSELDETK